jgi:hypothetical protein
MPRGTSTELRDEPWVTRATPDARQLVVLRDATDHRAAHDHATCEALGRLLAGIKGIAFAGHYDARRRYARTPYFVPTDTLVGVDLARSLGIESVDDLFGGVVPYPFVATKSISHRLIDERAYAPEGWSDDFADEVSDVVLDGFTAFDRDDARRAARELMKSGPVRMKRALGIGGLGQDVVHDATALEVALHGSDSEEIRRYGIAIEQDLADVTTYSVGYVCVDDLAIAYCGTQRTTRSNRGHEVYGGSELLVARGGIDGVGALELPGPARDAVAKARAYDRAALRCFPGFIASRRNYDVAAGVDSMGGVRSGVLEQSWRAGGASGAEVAALRAFQDDAALQAVRAWSTEAYGEIDLPDDALVYYAGDDNHGGRLTKYARIERLR